jgi:hypothetical protein
MFPNNPPRSRAENAIPDKLTFQPDRVTRDPRALFKTTV